MDETVVTNEQFAKFVAATGYVTIAERTPTKEEFPDAPEANLVAGWSFLRRLITKFLSTITFSGGPT